MRCIEVKKNDAGIYEEYGKDFEEILLNVCEVFTGDVKITIDKYVFYEEVLLYSQDGKVWLYEKEYNRAIEA